MKKATLLKLVAAAIVPGGFIIWGLHELTKFARRSKRASDSSSETGTVDSTHGEADKDQ